MADYITNTTELTSIADAIRTKGGTSESLVYPNGFVSAIEAISSGGDNSWVDISESFQIDGTYDYFKATYNENLNMVHMVAQCGMNYNSSNDAWELKISNIVLPSQYYVPEWLSGQIGFNVYGFSYLRNYNYSQNGFYPSLSYGWAYPNEGFAETGTYFMFTGTTFTEFGDPSDMPLGFTPFAVMEIFYPLWEGVWL